MEENTHTPNEEQNNQEQPIVQESQTEQQVIFNDEAFHHLQETRKWTLFLSILGFVALGLGIVAAIIMSFIFQAMPNTPSPFHQIQSFQIIPLTLILLLYFFPIYFLFQFSEYSKRAIREKNAVYLNKALKYLKYHYRFIGILTIILISIYILIFIGIVAFGAFGAFTHMNHFS